MRKLILVSIAFSVFALNTAFAQNMGVLSDDQKPQNLVSVSDFLNFLSTPHDAATTDRSGPSGSGRSDLWYGYGGYGGYYPSYYGSYYYPYYGYGYGYGYWLNDQAGDGHSQGTMDRSHITANHSNAVTNAATDTSEHVRDAAHVPVVCFASDASGTFFADADIASNVAKIQQSANNECLAVGTNCTQNLGCALIDNNR